tara:strand:- start:127 stop:420 length:294 start_codon:yes stop_codon:yes gene_type:complete
MEKFHLILAFFYSDYLPLQPKPITNVYRHRIDRINFPGPVYQLSKPILQQTQPTDSKKRVEHVRHILRPVSNAAILTILALENKVPQLLLVDPIHST